jgi:hypothetical protein
MLTVPSKGQCSVNSIDCAYVIKIRGQIPGRIHADLSAIASGFIPPANPRLDLYFNETKTEVSENAAIATGFHDPGRSYKDWSYTSTKPKREVSGDNSPGHIWYGLISNSLGVS